jgi:hypothetical protein
VITRLVELLDAATSEIRTTQPRAATGPDTMVEIAGATYVIDFRSSSSTAQIVVAIEQVRAAASTARPGTIPLVAVPFMGPVGRQRCENAGVSWLDLSGNARIIAPGIRILAEGRPNRFKSRGRPSSVFAPKSARIARWLLMHAGDRLTQREIARATDMDEGFTSRIVSRLVDQGLVVRDKEGRIRPRDPDLLLDAWREVYDFSRHRIIRGHLAARTGEDALRRLARGLQDQGMPYAATGLAASWLLTRFAGFRLTTVYLAEEPSPATLDSLGLREETRGANVWLVVPKDEGVFQGAEEQGEVMCVHPVQTYLDLAGQPERAPEAAEHLRATILKWEIGA